MAITMLRAILPRRLIALKLSTQHMGTGGTPPDAEYVFGPEEEVDDADLTSYNKFIRAKILLREG